MHGLRYGQIDRTGAAEAAMAAQLQFCQGAGREIAVADEVIA